MIDWPKNPNRRIFNRELAMKVIDASKDVHPSTDTYPVTFLQRGSTCLGQPMKNGNGSIYGNVPHILTGAHKNIYITFSGERYERETALIVGKYASLDLGNGQHIPCGAHRLGADKVLVYDDKWLIEETNFTHKYSHLFKEGNHGFGWFSWKPYVIADALSKLDDGDVVLYTDADTFPISDLRPFYAQCRNEGGILLFAACGCSNRHWNKRDCMILMGMDDDQWRDKQHAVARFMLFEKSKRSIEFLNLWLNLATDLRATTFDDSVLAPEYDDCVQHRCEQAILTNLAHKYELPLHREPCEGGVNCARYHGVSNV